MIQVALFVMSFVSFIIVAVLGFTIGVPDIITVTVAGLAGIVTYIKLLDLVPEEVWEDVA